MQNILGLLVALLSCSALGAQYNHQDFVGAGHQRNISVSTSSQSSDISGEATIDGFSVQDPEQLRDASRFLAQASFGADFATIDMTAAMGYEAWLDEQFALPTVSISSEMRRIVYANEEEDPEDFGISSFEFERAWVTTHLASPDLLRQRMAFALSQIMVTNRAGDLFEDVGMFAGQYYDMLSRNSFGQYRNLLLDVTIHPTMGIFLSHFNNRKANPELNTQPDENYAREIMQLFSIGLWELNPNGTRRLGDQGQFLPTYTNADIKEFAQVFTGLTNGLTNGFLLEDGPGFLAHAAAGTPMRMYDEYHDTSSKILLNGTVLPAGQSGMDDIRQTIAHLSTHPNTAPFICKQLIQRFTTSNPSPFYVADVAQVFDPNQENNFQEVLRAILLHPQARNCNPTSATQFGKLREPMHRVMNMMRNFQLRNLYEDEEAEFDEAFYELGCLSETVGQFPLAAPSVFNFYRPDYQPQGPISMNNMVAPEFQILNSTNAIGILNDVNTRMVMSNHYFCESEESVDDFDYAYGEGDPDWLTDDQDFSSLAPMLNQPQALVAYLDLLLANGMLEDDTKSIIANAVSQLETPQERLRMALYLIFISPDYAILK
ncbi:MAG: DUF1800 family protein [Bacteroidota bacterium]